MPTKIETGGGYQAGYDDGNSAGYNSGYSAAMENTDGLLFFKGLVNHQLVFSCVTGENWFSVNNIDMSRVKSISYSYASANGWEYFSIGTNKRYAGSGTIDCSTLSVITANIVVGSGTARLTITNVEKR